MITKAVDPWAGSYYVESLTHELVEKAWAHIQEIEEIGGMAKAIEQGIPKMRIEEAAAKKQARIDVGLEQIVGVNVFQQMETQELETLEVDNTQVLEMQIRSIEQIKASRDEAKVADCLAAIEQAAASGAGNLLELAVNAARERATLGEISLAMENAFGRYVATGKAVSGVYAKEVMDNKDFNSAREQANKFAELEGRRPRIMVAKLGQDGHDRGAKVIASSFADLGFDVDIGPLFQTPEEAARQAAENDVHILGVSSLAAGHKTLVPQTIKALADLGRSDILVVVGGVIPQKDYDFLYEQGVAGVFGPGTKISKAANSILEILMPEA